MNCVLCSHEITGYSYPAVTGGRLCTDCEAAFERPLPDTRLPKEWEHPSWGSYLQRNPPPFLHVEILDPFHPFVEKTFRFKRDALKLPGDKDGCYRLPPRWVHPSWKSYLAKRVKKGK